MRFLLCSAIVFGLTHPLCAQVAKPDTATKPPAKIEDNSFLIEEAYNQEAGVVQHIGAFQRARDGSFAFTFTQEWPALVQKHQLSYSIPILRADALGTGIGDVAINYRYQALGKDEEALWFSPRVSVYVPTGDVGKGRGTGGAGLELMLPFSYSWNDAFVTHFNASLVASRANNGLGSKTTTRSSRIGASAIWLLAPTFNFMLESTIGRTAFIGARGRVESENTFVVSPGMRMAINFTSGLQIVPGIAFPIGFGPSDGQRDVFLYLSFEHPFK